MVSPGVMANNADHSRWDLAPDPLWQEAPEVWQKFYKEWSAVDTDEMLNQETLTLHPEGIDLFVRESYGPLFDRVFKVGARSPEGGVLITGQPGIGKTLFLWYSLIRLITLHQVVLFANGSRLYLFFKEKVFSARVSSMPEIPVFRDNPVRSRAFIWTLIDNDFQERGPEAFLVERPCFPIHAAPLNPVRFRAWAKQRLAERMSLPLWSTKELWTGLRLQPRYSRFRMEMASYLPPSPSRPPPDFPEHMYAHRVLCELWKDDDNMDEGEDTDDLVSRSGPLAYDPDKEIDYAFWLLLNDAIEKYGFAACDVYNTILHNPQEILHDHECAITSTTYASLSAMVQHFIERQFLPYEDNRLLAVSSNCPPPFYLTTFSLDFKSPWIAERVMREIARAESDRLGDVYQLLKSSAFL